MAPRIFLARGVKRTILDYFEEPPRRTKAETNMAARQKEAIASFTDDELRVYADRLREIAKRLDEFRENVPGKEKWAFRRPSLEDGLRRIESFDKDLRRTLMLAYMKKPLGPKSEKSDLP